MANNYKKKTLDTLGSGKHKSKLYWGAFYIPVQVLSGIINGDKNEGRKEAFYTFGGM